MNSVSDSRGEVFGHEIGASTGWGLWLTFIGSVLMLTAALLGAL